MDDNRWYTLTALGIGGAMIVGLLAGLGLGGVGSSTGAAPAPTGGVSTATVTITIAWNPTSGLDEMFPGNFTIEHGAQVHLEIVSYDNGSNQVAAGFTGVMGTVGGTETITTDGAARVVSSLPADGIAHTFTIMGMAGGSMQGTSMSGGELNVVVPPAPSADDPVTVDVTTYFNGTGAWTWMCVAPCDPTSMATSGLMTGTVTVV